MIKVRFVEVEGSPEEVMKVSHLFRGGSERTEPELEPVKFPVPVNGSSITPELVLRVLTRRELHQNAKKVLKALRDAKKNMTSEELAKAVGIDRGQLAGVLGAFGRRIKNTDGWPSDAEIIEVFRDENNRRRYRLPEVVHTALSNFNL